MIVIGGENLIDFVQTATENDLPVYTAKPGGSCYNVAMAAARQGQEVVYLTPISKDSLGNVLAQRLLDDGVHFAAPRSDKPTSLAVVSLNKSIPSYQFYRNGTAERDVTLDDLHRMMPENAHVFHIGSLALIDGEDGAAWEAFFEAQAKAGVLTSLDPNVRPGLVSDRQAYVDRLLRMTAHAGVIKLSDEDLEYIFPDMPLMDAFTAFCDAGHAALAVLTKGAEGCFARTASVTVTLPATLADPLVDTVGAGDTFMATLVSECVARDLLTRERLAALDEAELTDILSKAGKAAAINCQRQGCNPPSQAELS